MIDKIDKKISQLGDTWKDTKLHVEELIKQLQSNVEVNSTVYSSGYSNAARRVFICCAKVGMILGNHSRFSKGP